jgi:hypothetical protein
MQQDAPHKDKHKSNFILGLMLNLMTMNQYRRSLWHDRKVKNSKAIPVTGRGGL